MSVPEPSKILTPWATSGLKNAIPAAANPVTGNAGYDQGFPAINMTPKEAGGIPPFGQDFNGILFAVTEALRYLQAGGMPTFSSSLATAIGGYPKGATILGNDGATIYRSLINSNSDNPNTLPSNWAVNEADKFPATLFSQGTQKLPSGLIIQWGVVTATTTGAAFLYPMAFPNQALRITPGTVNGASAIAVSAGSITNTGGTMFCASSSVSTSYIAIGW